MLVGTKGLRRSSSRSALRVKSKFLNKANGDLRYNVRSNLGVDLEPLIFAYWVPFLLSFFTSAFFLNALLRFAYFGRKDLSQFVISFLLQSSGTTVLTNS